MKKPMDSSENRTFFRSILIGTLLGLLLVFVFFLGFYTQTFVNPESEPISIQQDIANFPLLSEVESLLQTYYLRDLPDATEREYAAIRGVLTSLGDRNTFFIDPPVAQSESDVLAGTYGGIGASVRRDIDGAILLTPFPDSPAANAGIVDGDVLIAINEMIIDSTFSIDSIDQMLRGEVKEGNGVELQIMAQDTDQTLFIPFDVIRVPSVIWRLTGIDETHGYIQILRFTNRTPEEFIDAIDDFKSQNVEGLILDLRNNSGGLLHESVMVAGMILGKEVIYIQRTNSGEKTFISEEESVIQDLPLVVIVNGSTASAAELVAGAVQDYDRGALIGQQTFGKGTIQQIFPLSDSSSIHITAAEWMTPKYGVLEGVGLTPDIILEPDQQGRDIELDAALNHLQQEVQEK